jgi:hypothetical protein
MSARKFEHDLNGNIRSVTEYDWFDPALADPFRDAAQGGVPTQVPSAAVVLRVQTTIYYNEAIQQSSPNVYHKRVGDIGQPTPLILNAPSLMTVGPSQTEFHYDGNDNTAPTKGNLTKQRMQEGTKWIEFTHTYDPVTGNRTSTTDADDNVTQFFYDATLALPSSVVVDPLNGTGQQTTSTMYDFETGLPLKITDANGKETTTSYFNHLLNGVDPFGRSGTVTDPQGRKVVMRYHDLARKTEVWSDLNSPSDELLKSRSTTDQLGRVIKTESSEDGTSYSVFADTIYQQMGRITITTNAMRSQANSTDGWARATKDDLGRVVTVETFDGRYPAGNINWSGDDDL